MDLLLVSWNCARGREKNPILAYKQWSLQWTQINLGISILYSRTFQATLHIRVTWNFQQWIKQPKAIEIKKYLL